MTSDQGYDWTGPTIATRAPKADAYLAGEPAEAVLQGPAEVSGIKFDNRWKAVPMPPTPKPVTWPDGVMEMHMADGTLVAIEDGWVAIVGSGLRFKWVEARQLAALLLAAADYVGGQG